jgi:hypothetical protein
MLSWRSESSILSICSKGSVLNRPVPDLNP